MNPFKRTGRAGLFALVAALAWPAAAAARQEGGKPARPAAVAASFAGHAEARRFAAEVAERRGLPRPWLDMQIDQARRVASVRKLVMPAPAGTAKNWAAYRERFIEPRRIRAGIAFWQANEAALQRAERRYGVPAEVVVGVIGVETFYGRITGNFRVIDALATLAFDFPPGRSDRSAFFRGELEEFLVWSAQEGVDPQKVKGSFAGAMGLPQFMPGSINRWAVDHDGDGHVDLLGSAADAVGSVANYLQVHGWQPGLATHHEVTVPADAADRAVLLAPDILPTFSAAQFAERGAVLDEAGRAHTGPLALVQVENGGRPPSHVAGTQNFYAITRYNQSSYYALAVIELGRAVAAARATR
ncbi:MAG TPA: lytic murein transglycosylase B [Rubrivivax sp.]|nr:lytic murein transglycosylase B [Rubrivivax sp.]